MTTLKPHIPSLLENRGPGLPRVPPLTVLTGVAVVTLGALAAAREPVAGAVVLARAVQVAARPVLPWETFCWQDTDRKKQTNKRKITDLTQKSSYVIACIAEVRCLYNKLQSQGERLL